MIQAIIFDFAGVIVSEGYWNWLEKNIPNIAEREDFFMDLSRKVDSTQISERELVEIIGKEANKTPEEVEQGMFNEFNLNTELISLIQKLKQNYKIGFLSNFPKEWKQKLFGKFNLQKYFDAVVVSTEVGGIIKPYPEIYKTLLQKLQVQPKEAVFIDDRQTNVDGAKRIGMQGIVFISGLQLVNDLIKIGIIISE